MKKTMFFLLASIVSALVLAGCGQSDDEEKAFPLSLAVSDVSEKAAEKTATAKQERDEAAVQGSGPEDGFTVSYQGQEADNKIELRHCECVFDRDDIQIYAKYLYWLSVPETFPCDQYVLYIRTSEEELQLYPVKDFLVDEECGFLHTIIEGDNGFEKVQSMSFLGKDGSLQNSQREIFNLKQAEDMLCSAYGEVIENGREEGSFLFSNITVGLEEVSPDNTGILTGYIGGVERETGRHYYVDWEMDTEDGGLTSELCVLKEYDPIRDQEEFAACSRIFDRIEQGDWCVKPDRMT